MQQLRNPRLARLFILPVIGILLAACAAANPSPSSVSTISLPSLPAGSTSAVPAVTGSAPPDTGGATAVGDIPDTAVFLTYAGGVPPFQIQYVEGWQVTTLATGVRIADKDSGETVAVVAAQPDVSGYVTGTDLPTLQAQGGFTLVKRDVVMISGVQLEHLVFHLPSPPDPVTGKQVPSTVDRYYVPGPAGLAVVSLSTPDGVDNIDAFRLMITSFRWQ